MCQKALDLGFPHLLWIAKLMKTDKALCPVQIRLFGLVGILLDAQLIAQRIHELRQVSLAPLYAALFASAHQVRYGVQSLQHPYTTKGKMTLMTFFLTWEHFSIQI